MHSKAWVTRASLADHFIETFKPGMLDMVIDYMQTSISAVFSSFQRMATSTLVDLKHFGYLEI